MCTYCQSNRRRIDGYLHYRTPKSASVVEQNSKTRVPAELLINPDYLINYQQYGTDDR